MLTSAEIGQRWKVAREAAGLSAIEAGKASGYHKNHVYALENGKDGVTLRFMLTLAPIYGITLDEIFHEEGDVPRLPAEFRPLLEPMMHMDAPTREAVIKNVASNLMFMGRTFAAVAHEGRAPKKQGVDDATTLRVQKG